MALIYSPQASALKGRRSRISTNNMTSTTPTPYYDMTKTEETEAEPEYEYSKGYKMGLKGAPDLRTGYYKGILTQDMLAYLEETYNKGIKEGVIEPGATDWDWEGAINEYREKFKVPEDELNRLRQLPAGEGVGGSAAPEGFEADMGSSTAMGTSIGQANAASLAAQKGDVLGAVSHGGQAVLGAITGLDALKGVVSGIKGTAEGIGEGIAGLLGLGEGDLAGLDMGFGETASVAEGMAPGAGGIGGDGGIGGVPGAGDVGAAGEAGIL